MGKASEESLTCQLPACKSWHLKMCSLHSLPGERHHPWLFFLPSQGGLMSHWFSCRVTCLCAQPKAVQHGLKRSRGLCTHGGRDQTGSRLCQQTETGTAQPGELQSISLPLCPFNFYLFFSNKQGSHCAGPLGAEARGDAEIHGKEVSLAQSVPVLSGMLIERKPPFVQNSQSHVLVTGRPPGGPAAGVLISPVV